MTVILKAIFAWALWFSVWSIILSSEEPNYIVRRIKVGRVIKELLKPLLFMFGIMFILGFLGRYGTGRIEKAEYDNMIITGSFLEKGFKFNDIDVIIVSEEKIDADYIEKILKSTMAVMI